MHSSHRITWCAAVAAGIALLPATGAALEPTETEPSTVVTTNPLGLVNGLANVEIDRALAQDLSAVFGVNFLVVEPLFAEEGGRTIFGVGPQAGVRFFAFGEAPEGVFLHPFVETAWLNKDGEEDFGYAVGAMFGGTVIPYDLIALSAGVGFAWNDMVIDFEGEDGTERTLGVDGYAPRFRLAAGFAF